MGSECVCRCECECLWGWGRMWECMCEGRWVVTKPGACVCVYVWNWEKNIGTARVEWVRQRLQLEQGLVHHGKFRSVLNVCEKASVRGHFIYTLLEQGDVLVLSAHDRLRKPRPRELEWFLQSPGVCQRQSEIRSSVPGSLLFLLCPSGLQTNRFCSWVSA